MTTNHPAQGPVSVERLQQISEILSKAAAQSDGGNLGYAMTDAVKVIDGAIAAFGVEPVAYMRIDGEDVEYNGHNEFSGGGKGVPLYTTPPAPVVDWVPLGDSPYDVPYSMPSNLRELIAEEIGILFSDDDAQSVWNACRAAMLKSFGNSEQLDEVGSWDNHMNTPTDKPAINTDELLKHIEGMEVSVDVSTCDADAGHRYFGTVTEISELDTARNGYILLVQDAKPNFKPAGNSPAIGIDLASEPDRSVEVRYFAPSGYVMVPVEPTMAMLDEFDSIIDYGAEDSKDAWSRLIAAAPKQE